MKAKAAPETERALSLMFEVGRIVRHACVAGGDLPLPLAHLETLLFVGKAKNPSMRDVAEYLRITAPSATAIADDLAARGLLARKADAKDRRLVRLSLSAAGKTLLAKSTRLRTDVLRGIIGTLGAADQRELTRILSKLVNA